MKKLLLLLTIFTCHLSSAQVLATVGKSKITVEDFKRKFNSIKKKVNNPPTPEQFLEDLIRFEVGVQEAEKTNLRNDPLVKDSFDQVLYNAVIEKAIGQKVESIKISDSELKEFYKNNPELRLAHVYIEVKPTAKPEEKKAAQARAKEVYEEIVKSKRPFEDFVKLYSDDYTTKDFGGDMGFVSRVTLHPALYANAQKLKIGEVKGPIEGAFGFHIIKLLDRRSFDLADKRQIRAAIFDEKRAKLFNDYFEKLKKQYKIQVNKETLKSTQF